MSPETLLSGNLLCPDARHAKCGAVTTAEQVRSQRPDLAAQIVRTAWYREVTIKSLDSRLSHSLIKRCVLEYSLP